MKKNEILEEILKEVDKHPEIMSRRDALKYLTVSPLAASLLASATAGASSVSASNVKGKIVIVGGGLAGMSTAARINNSISDADITVIEPNPLSTSYQPGQTLVGGGIWDKSEVMFNRDDYVPDGVKIIKGSVTAFDPDNNKVIVDGKQEVSYDQMIVATGLMLNYKAIKGLTGEITSTSPDNAEAKKTIGKNGVYSIYFQDGSEDTWKGIQELIAKAKKWKKGEPKLQALFTHPNTPIKCGGAPKKIMYLTHAQLEKAGVREAVELTFYPNGGKMFGVPEYHEAIVNQFKTRGFKWNYKHNLTEIDTEAKIATFNHHWTEKGEWDEDLEEYGVVLKSEDIKVPYDFIHVTPPMKAPDIVAFSKVGSSKGWVPVKKETLQHARYKNVWALGDVAAVPMGKTGGSARKQYKVVVSNMIAAMEGKKLEAQYYGYTVCPLITSIGTVMLAEFNWTKKPTPMVPLDPTQERWIWWLLKVYLLKPMTQIGMLSGRA
jgi:sulfide:quinone oxidoreductase